MSLIDSRSKFLLYLDEQADAVYPSDACGNLADPTIPAGLVLPTVVSGTIGGYGRNYVRTAPSGLLFSDAGDALRLTRGVTVAAILRLDVASLANGNYCNLIQRGRTGGSDPVAFGIRLKMVSTTNQRVTLRMFWETTGGVEVADIGVDFYWPGTEYCFLVATREVVDGLFTCRYQINGDQATGGTTAALDVGGITAAAVSVGMGMSGASYVNHLDGVLDYLEVLNEAVSPEEMLWTWQRLTVDMPGGVTTMRRMVPPGVYSQDPSSRIQLELANEGRALGHAKAIGRLLREYNLPDVAWGERLSKWEELTGRPARGGDSIAERRLRVLDATQNLRTFTLPDLKTQLEEPFDLVSADISILEYGNDLTEAFASGTPSSHAVVVVGDGVWLSDGAAVAAGYQQHTATSDDLRYGGADDVGAGLYLWPLDGDGEDAWLHGKVDVVTLPDDTVYGFALGRRDTDDWLFVGIAATAGTQRVAYLRYTNGVLSSSLTTLETWATDPTYFRIHYVGVGSYLIKYGTSDANAKAHAGSTHPGPVDPQWGGLCAVTKGSGSAVSGVVRFDDVFIHAPRGGARFNWYAYRNPGLAGGPVMEAARALVKRAKPAHTTASAITQTAVLCDDATRLTDREPIGA